MDYRLGIDLGTNSLGWCMLRLNNSKEPVAVIKAGVRLFHDGRQDKTKAPLSVERREARGIRRNIDRRIMRQNYLLKLLTENEILPQDEETRKSLAILNPYELRYNAINKEIPIYHIGRIILHLSKHRGFKSNRKSGKEKEDGKIKNGIERLKEAMDLNKNQTVGAYLYSLMQEGKTVRARLGKVNGKDGYELYLSRSLIEEEYDIIMNNQKKYHNKLTDDLISEIKTVLFFQRPLKPQKVGKCSIMLTETKMPKAHSVAQDYIMLQKINDLRVFDNDILRYRELTFDEKNIIKRELSKKKEMDFDAVRKLLKKYFLNTKYGMFSHETTDKKINGNNTNYVMGSKNVLGDIWYSFTDEEKYNLIDKLLSNKSDDELHSILADEYKFNNEQIDVLLNNVINKLSTGYLRYGKTVVFKLKNIMDEKNIDLYNAINEAGFSEKNNHIEYEILPYYGEILQESVVDPQIDNPKNDEEKYGKISNPTVHIALNQLRKLINELITKYGKPKEIVLELARDLKNSKAKKEEIIKINNKNRELNQKADEFISKIEQDNNIIIPKNKLNRDKYKLWVELEPINRCCVYTGQQISQNMLFTDEVQIEHIVPFSKCLDDSMNNKTLSLRNANYYKSNRTPYEAFKDNKDGYNYEEICNRAKIFNKSKYERFTENAYKIYEKDGGDFIARQLTDTQYISRIALKYLKSLYKENESNIWTIPGQLTALIRRHLGLNNLLAENGEKNRNDHRHHAIDAFVISITTRSFLQKISSAANYQEDYNNQNVSVRRNRLMSINPDPFPNFRQHIERAVNNIKTSHKPDRSLSGRLHEETAYGILRENIERNGTIYNLVRRVTLDIDNVKSEEIRDIELSEISKDKAKFQQVVNDRKIRHLRMLKKDNPIIEIKNKNDKIYKGFTGGNNICAEVYQMPDGKRNVEVISLFDANQKGFKPKWMKEHPDAKLIMRLFKGDVIGFIDNRIYKYYIIQQIKSVAKNFGLVELNGYGNNEKKCKFISFNKLFNEMNAGQFNISLSGIISKKKYATIDFWNK